MRQRGLPWAAALCYSPVKGAKLAPGRRANHDEPPSKPSRWPTADNKRSGPPGPCFAWAISGGQSQIQAVKGGQDLLLRRLFARGRVATLATYPGQTRTKSRTR